MASGFLYKLESGSLVCPEEVKKYFASVSTKQGKWQMVAARKCLQLLKACVVGVSTAGMPTQEDIVCACIDVVLETAPFLEKPFERDQTWITATCTEIVQLLLLLMRDGARVWSSYVLCHCGSTMRKFVGLIERQESESAEAREAYELMWKVSKKQDKKGSLMLRKEALLLICNEDVELSWLSRRISDCSQAVDRHDTAQLMQSIYDSILPVIREKLSAWDQEDLLTVVKLHVWHITLCCTLQQFEVAKALACNILRLAVSQRDSSSKILACSLCRLCIGGVHAAEQKKTSCDLSSDFDVDLKTVEQLIESMSCDGDHVSRANACVQTGLLIKPTNKHAACGCLSEAIRLLSNCEVLTYVAKDTLATASFSVALCFYEQCGKKSTECQQESKDRIVCDLTFDEDGSAYGNKGPFAPTVEAVLQHLTHALDVWTEMVSSSESQSLTVELLAMTCKNILIAGRLLQLFDQHVLAVKAHCLALNLCSLLSDHPFTISTVCTAVKLLVNIGEFGQGATLLLQADDELCHMASPPEWLVFMVDIEKCRLLWHEGNVTEASQYAIDLLGRPFMEQRYQLPLILQARLYSLCSCLLSVESSDPSLIVYLRKRIRSLPLTRLEPLLEAVNILASLANVKKICEKGTELLLTDKRSDLVWVIMTELMEGIQQLSLIYMEQQLSGNCIGLLTDGLEMAGVFSLHGWQSRFHRCLGEGYALTGEIDKCEIHLALAKTLVLSSVEDPVAVQDRVLVSLTCVKNEPLSQSSAFKVLDEMLTLLSGLATRVHGWLTKHHPEMILPVKQKLHKPDANMKRSKWKKKQQQTLTKNKLLVISLVKVLAVKSEMCLVDKDFPQSILLSEKAISLLHGSKCKWERECQCSLVVTEPVLAAHLLYCYATACLGVDDQTTESVCQLLERSLSLIHRCNPVQLLRSVCHSLVYVNAASNPWEAAYYMHLCTACCLNHQAVRLWTEQIRKFSNDDSIVEGVEWLALLQYQKCLVAQVLMQPSELKSQLSELLPPDWSVCGMGLLSLPFVDDLILAVTRIQAFSRPRIVLRLLQHDQKEEECRGKDCDCSVYLREKFDDLLVKMMGTSSTNKKLWKSTRTALDSSLLTLLHSLEDGWLGCWKGLVFGEVENGKQQQQMKVVAKKIIATFTRLTGVATEEEDWRLLLNVVSRLNDKQIEEYIQTVFGSVSLTSSTLSKVVKRVKDAGIRLFSSAGFAKRLPVILILDKSLQQLPWESIPLLRQHDISRMPSLVMTCCHLHSINVQFHIDTHNTFYILDPEQNIEVMNSKFQEWFTTESGWSGLVAEKPTADHYKKALTERDLFLYLGHGNGRQYVSSGTIEKLRCRPVTFLFGCSSGKLVTHGYMEPTGVPYSYLLAGCPALVGNLWNVLDRDMSSFAETVVKQLLSDCDGASLSTLISFARSSCNYKNLIGAAPVIYGLPLVLNKQ